MRRARRLGQLAALILCCSLAATLQASAQTGFQTEAEAAILVDLSSGQVLYTKNADVARPPASMSKLMTAFMVFERLGDGTLSLDDRLPVSEKAWRKGGSKMFVEVGDRVRLEDLLRGIIIQSGNDACIVVAEHIAGSEEAFAVLMTERARELGLSQSTFKNASGWPDPGHEMSVRDLATLASLIILNYPQFYHFYGEAEFTYNEITQGTRNPLLRAGIEGVDGLKTGHTSEAGYGLVASAERDGRRLVAVVAGLQTPGARRRESERLLEYGFRNFQAYRLFAAEEAIDSVEVWMGDKRRVPLIAGRDVSVTLARELRDELEVAITYDTPLVAPLARGTEAGVLTISAPDMDPQVLPLYVGEEVEAGGSIDRLTGALRYLVWGPS